MQDFGKSFFLIKEICIRKNLLSPFSLPAFGCHYVDLMHRVTAAGE
jgi:hypothetical protein